MPMRAWRASSRRRTWGSSLHYERRDNGREGISTSRGGVRRPCRKGSDRFPTEAVRGIEQGVGGACQRADGNDRALTFSGPLETLANGWTIGRPDHCQRSSCPAHFSPLPLALSFVNGWIRPPHLRLCGDHPVRPNEALHV